MASATGAADNRSRAVAAFDGPDRSKVSGSWLDLWTDRSGWILIAALGEMALTMFGGAMILAL